MTLADECRLLTRYLLDRDPGPDIRERYAAAHEALHLHSDEPEVRFLHRHPRLLPLLDAAAGVLRPQSLLRKKVYLMTALLEATPEHADFFLQQPNGVWPSLAGLFWQGLRGAAKALLGIPLLLLARRTA